jgi:hypothetical protein
MHKTSRTMLKCRTFELFKANPYFFRDPSTNNVELPTRLLERSTNFLEYIERREKFRTLTLDYATISQTESLLSQLLDLLLKQNVEHVTSVLSHSSAMAREMTHTLRQSIEQLLCLGIIIGGDQGIT